MSAEERAAALVSNDLIFSGAMAVTANPLEPGQPPKLYAPAPYDSSSSVSHWDRAYDPLGLLLLPSAAQGVPEKVYLVAMERGVLYDIGYTPARPKLAMEKASGETRIRFSAIPGAFYRLRAKSALHADWTPVGVESGVQAAATELTLTDVSSDPVRFYSVEIVPERFSPQLRQQQIPRWTIPRAKR